MNVDALTAFDTPTIANASETPRVPATQFMGSAVVSVR